MKTKSQTNLLTSLKTEINQRLVFTLVLFSVFYVSYYSYTINFITKYLVDNLISHFRPTILTEIIWYATIIYIIDKTIKQSRIGYKESINVLIVYLFVSIFYLVERYSNNFVFTPLLSLKYVKYFDLLILLFTKQIILKGINLLSKSKLPAQNSNGLLNDIPITTEIEDILKRSFSANELVRSIKITQTQVAFAVGINGKWGNGKTSYLNILKEKLGNQNSIIIDFNPWLSLNKNNIISDFFRALQNALKKYDTTFSTALPHYTELLSKAQSPDTIKSILSLINSFTSENIKDSFEKINKNITALKKNIYIFIDDLDRLQKEEIVEVLKLIRNSASFGNTFFFVAYDKDYLQKSLSDFGSVNNGSYLDKIFQVEIQLPMIDAVSLRAALVTNLKKNIDPKYHSEINKLISPSASKDSPFLDSLILNLRDVSRFVNNFIIHFKQVEDEVYYTDYFNISLIRYKYYQVLEYVYNNYEDLFEIVEKENPRINLKMEGTKTKLNVLISSKCSVLNITEEEAKLIIDTLQNIFGLRPKSDQTKGQELLNLIYYADRPDNSIIFPNYFYRYFSHQIFLTDIATKEWDKIIHLPTDELLPKLKEFIAKGLRKEVYFRLSKLISVANKTEFESYISIIFSLSSFKTKNDESDYACYFDFDKLFNFIYKNSPIVKNLYIENEFADFLKTFLTNCKSPFLFPSEFIRFITTDLNKIDSLNLPGQELILINVDYLKKYIEKLDKPSWDIFYNCEIIEFQEGQRYRTVIHPSAKETMIDFFKKKGAEYFINNIAIKGDKEFYKISEYVWIIFDTPTNLLNFINRFERTDLIDEFIRFFEESQKQNFLNYIKFNFNIINLGNTQIQTDRVNSILQI